MKSLLQILAQQIIDPNIDRILLTINTAVVSLKKKTIILCSPSRAYYRTDFDVFGLKMTVKEWSNFLPRKNWGFQNASLQKCLLRFKGGADYLLGIHLQIMKRWADYLEQDGFVYIICLLAANDMFGLCVSKKGEGGGGAEGAVLACNPPSPPESGGVF